MPRFGRPLRRVGPPAFPGRRPFGPIRPLAPAPIQALANAHRLYNSGQFGPAAQQYEMLAGAAGAGRMRFAPRLYFMAAQAHWRAGQIPQGMQLLRTGLEILLAAGALMRLRQISTMAIEELTQLGHPQEAEEVKKFLVNVPEGAGQTAAAPAAQTVQSVLPTHCGQCGAAVRSDEVDWIDERTAECAYCGSPIRSG